MKLASLKEGRDGVLVIVSDDLRNAVRVPQIAPTLQSALDNWAAIEPELIRASDALGLGKLKDGFKLEDFSRLTAPLPRCFNWSDGSVYLNHMELVRRARGAEMPTTFLEEPLMYQGGSDDFKGCRDPIDFNDDEWGIDFEAEVAVVLDDVPMGVTEAEAGKHIKLITIVNDVSLRNIIPGELSKGFGFYQGKPASAFAPVVVTPDALGDAWDGGKLIGPMVCEINGQEFGRPDAGIDMNFEFPRLIAHAARTRRLCAGTVIGSGTVSNRNRSVGSSCIAEARMIEIIEEGQPRTPFLKFNDRVRIAYQTHTGSMPFGDIEQCVVRAQ